MELNIDNRKREAMYVDKELSQVANNKEVYKLITKDNNNSLRLIIDIFAGVLKLNESEADALYYITYMSQTFGYADVSKTKDVFKSNSLKSESTFNRAVEALHNKSIIHYLNNGKDISVNSKYYININDLDKANFLVIEVKPQVTSQAVDIY